MACTTRNRMRSIYQSSIKVLNINEYVTTYHIRSTTKQIKINPTHVAMKSNNMKKRNLYFLALALGLGALGEVGDHAEAAAGVLDEPDGRSPSFQSFFRRPLRIHLEVLSQVLLHSSNPSFLNVLWSGALENRVRVKVKNRVWVSQLGVRIDSKIKGTTYRLTLHSLSIYNFFYTVTIL